jgi:predicted ATPase
VRLVTLIGPPGVGKTRLAVQIARHIQHHFREGACFVTLAPLRDAGHLLPAIAKTIELADSGKLLASALADRLHGEQLLLVLDNFEHIIAAVPDVATLLAAVPTLKLLCTSRVPLRVLGEHEFVVPPLPLPELEHLPTITILAENPAVALFAARAQAAHAGFALTEENGRYIASICHRLDGLPLAIELAATRIKLFSPAALLLRLERRLPLLTSGARDAPARQRTLETAISWSYDLLTDMEKLGLSRLGIFWGGWILESAEVVCGDNVDLINTLALLVDHSLVQSVHLPGDEVRFTMLETIREFALTRLEERGEMSSVQARHAQHFLSLAVTGEKGLQGAEQVAWMERLNAESNNLRAAFAWCLSAEGDVGLGLQAAAALWWFWWTNGQVEEARRLFTDLLGRAKDAGLADTIGYGRALLGAGILAFFAGNLTAAMPQFEKARDISERLGDKVTQGYAIFMMGTVMMLSNQQDEAYAVLDIGGLILREAGEMAVWHVGVTSLARTLLSFESGLMDEAQQYADAGMAVFRQLGQPYGIGLAFNYQGDVARMRGDYGAAAECYQAALPLLHQANARSEIPAVLHNLAHIELVRADPGRAWHLFAEGLELHREIGNRMGIVECLVGLAATAILLHQPRHAATLLAVVDSLLAEINAPLFAGEQAVYQQAARAGKQELAAEVWAEAQEVGRAMTVAEVITFVKR